MSNSRAFNTTEWTILTALGLAGGLTAGVLAGIPLGQVLNAMIATALVVVIVGGVLGTLQAAGLRRLLSKPLWWIAATIAGVAIGLAFGVVIVEEAGRLITGTTPRVAQLSAAMRALSFVTLGFVAGTVVGFAQWLVLRSQHPAVRHWVLVSGAALAVAFCLASLIVDASGVPFASVLGRLAFVALSGLMFGGLTSRPLRSAIR